MDIFVSTVENQKVISNDDETIITSNNHNKNNIKDIKSIKKTPKIKKENSFSNIKWLTGC